MPRYRDDTRTRWYKRTSSAPLWAGTMLAFAFGVVFLVMFGLNPAPRQTASNTTAPVPTVPATFTSASDASK